MAFNVFNNAAQNLNQAGNIAGRVGNFQPMQINPGNVNIAGYMNPFQQQVINRTMAGLDTQQAQANNTLDAQASAAGAFGGSRHGVAQGITNNGFTDARANTLATLNAENYNQALGAGMGAAQANQNAGIAGAGLRLNGAGTLGNLSNIGFGQGMQINQQQMDQGGQQQALQQAIIDAAKNNWGGLTGQPNQSLAALLAGVGGVPYGQTQTNTNQPGASDFLSLLLGLA